MNIEKSPTQPLLGNTAQVTFAQFGDKAIEGKVDTGATTSSLHAKRIHVDSNSQTVSFICPALSPNVINLALVGAQEVHSADAGGNTRPVIMLDITVDGISINQATFNLNDRGEMDSEILIGQNVLQAGNFIIDPSKDTVDLPIPTRESEILAAFKVLAEHQVSVADVVSYIHKVATQKDDQ